VTPITDELLMLKVRDGEVETLSVLYERHRARLLNFFVRLTGDVRLGEDLVQEVFLRMLRYRHTFGQGKRYLGWMYQIARHAHYDYRRKRRHEVLIEIEELDGHATLSSPEPAPDARLNARDEAALLQDSLTALPLELREVLVLSRYQDLRYDEIARVLDCSVGAVKMRVHRALTELKEKLTELGRARAI
jgi:RNA polymerase sigma factor (sigma-70 family)